ncbi:FecCD family ABC transporter permease [Microbacterium album]|uniref:Enterobactin ABC transporter permease n=1 Tax=Microbacterium album TaxID=2053191 RepID=A0A917IDL6_9MICO|nr:iron ABC transporter permease [Microbacterium album]GGH34845.1 enterobactin ABC transporter permease [Microbacterium album]
MSQGVLFLGVRRATARRSAVVATVMAAIAALALGVALLLGDFVLSPGAMLQALFGGGTPIERYVVWHVRMPRAALALLAGAALGLAGALFQTMLRNPLASPDLLGISGGASVGAVFATLVAGWTGAAVAGAAFAGASIVAVVLLLAARTLADGGYRLVLAGVGIAFLCAAIVGYLLKRAQQNEAGSVLMWITGSLGATTWEPVLVLGTVLVGGAVATTLLARPLELSELGDPLVRGLGSRPAAVRAGVVLVAVLLAATTAAFIGPVSFVALCAAPIARTLVGRGALALPAAAFTGAALLLLADVVAQHAFPGAAVPVGVVTGAVGAPYLLWLLASSKGHRA